MFAARVHAGQGGRDTAWSGGDGSNFSTPKPLSLTLRKRISGMLGRYWILFSGGMSPPYCFPRDFEK
jgi:hypothetical protein